jgi:MFS family permease
MQWTKQWAQLAASERFRQLLVLLAAGCLTTMTGSITAPVFPEIIRDLQIDRSWAGILVSVHALTTALFTPVFGILADRVGKRQVLVPSLIFYAIFGASTALMQTLPLLLLTRGLVGAASGGIAAATIGMLGSMYEGEQRSRILGYATSAMTSVAILFPLIGGWVGREHWQHTFYLYGLGIPLAAIALFVFTRETSDQHAAIAEGQGSQLLGVVRQRDVLTLYLFIGAAALIMNATVVYAPLYLKSAIDADPTVNGIVLAMRAAGAAISAAVIASRLAKRFRQKGAIALGFLLMGATIFSIPSLTQLYLIIPVAALFGVGFGIITPNLYDLLAELAPVDLRASVLAIGTGFNALGLFVSPVILGPIWKSFGFMPVFYLAAGIAIAVSVLSLTLLGQGKRFKPIL